MHRFAIAFFLIAVAAADAMAATPCTVNINGPDLACGAMYCVNPPQTGVIYTWTLSGGSGTVSPTTGMCTTVSVTSASATLTVTAQLCGKTVTFSKTVKGCPTGLSDCCLKPGWQITNVTSVAAVSGYDITVTLSGSLTNVLRIGVDLLNESVTFSNPSCGTAHALPSVITSASPSTPGTIPSTLPVNNSHEVFWTWLPLMSINPTRQLKFHIDFPPRPAGCSDALHFCFKVSVTTSTLTPTGSVCSTCEVIRCVDINRVCLHCE